MTSTSTDPSAIEAELERDRAALASTLDTLSDRVSVDSLAKDALGMLRRNAGSGVSSVDRVVRTNPVAVALIGAGVAWMFLGPRLQGSSSSDADDDSTYYPSGTSASETYVSGSYGASPRYGEGSSSLGYDAGSGSLGGSMGGADGGSSGYGDASADDDHSWSREASGLRARAMAALRRIETEARSYASSLRGSSSEQGGRDFDAEREGVISRFTSDLRDRFAHGLDALSPEARDRVVAARERAYGAMLQAEQVGRDVVRDPSRVLEEHPIVAGAVAFALGAAVAAALPRTDVEDRAFGEERDRLMGDAARLLREERGRAMQIAGSLGQEIKSAAQETLGAVTEAAREQAQGALGAAQGALGAVAGAAIDKAQEAAGRVTERAAEEVQSLAGDLGQGASQGASSGGAAGSSAGMGSGDLPLGGSGGGSTDGATVVVTDTDDDRRPGGGSGGGSGLAGPGDPVIG